MTVKFKKSQFETNAAVAARRANTRLARQAALEANANSGSANAAFSAIVAIAALAVAAIVWVI